MAQKINLQITVFGDVVLLLLMILQVSGGLLRGGSVLGLISFISSAWGFEHGCFGVVFGEVVVTSVSLGEDAFAVSAPPKFEKELISKAL